MPQICFKVKIVYGSGTRTGVFVETFWGNKKEVIEVEGKKISVGDLQGVISTSIAAFLSGVDVREVIRENWMESLSDHMGKLAERVNKHVKEMKGETV